MQPPRVTIALDATYSLGANLSGVGVYSREILHGLAAAHPHDRFLWAYRPHRLLRALRLPRPANASARPLFEALPCGAPSLFHGLNQRLPRRRYRRALSTFHDLFVLTSEYSTPAFRARFAQQARDAAQRSDLILCVSSFTASQVESLLKIPASRLRVIPHGTHPPPPRPALPKEPLILHVGAIQKRKNLLRLVEAFEQSAPAPWRLCLAGSQGYGSAEILARIAQSPARARIETPGWLPDSELETLYARASIFAFPSLDEGFGIPVLEAMARALPVLSSNRSALPEACGGAALLVDPESPADLAHALHRLIESESLRANLISLGLARAAQTPWSRSVALTWQAYQELLP